jgi:hypothetical protein
MKKLIVKIKVIDIPYSPAVDAIQAIEAVEARPEKWVKDELEVFEAPLLEINPNEFEFDSSYTYHPAIAAVEGVEGVEAQPEILEVLKDEIIAQTQGSDEDLAQWLAGDFFKYPEGYWVEYIDISAQVEQERINTESLAYLASTDWLVIREVDASIPCPADVKLLRAEARSRIIR